MKTTTKKSAMEIQIHPNVAIVTDGLKSMKVPARHCDDYAFTVRELVRGWRGLAKSSGRTLIVRRFSAEGSEIARR